MGSRSFLSRKERKLSSSLIGIPNENENFGLEQQSDKSSSSRFSRVQCSQCTAKCTKGIKNRFSAFREQSKHESCLRRKLAEGNLCREDIYAVLKRPTEELIVSEIRHSNECSQKCLNDGSIHNNVSNSSHTVDCLFKKKETADDFDSSIVKIPDSVSNTRDSENILECGLSPKAVILVRRLENCLKQSTIDKLQEVLTILKDRQDRTISHHQPDKVSQHARKASFGVESIQDTLKGIKIDEENKAVENSDGQLLVANQRNLDSKIERCNEKLKDYESFVKENTLQDNNEKKITNKAIDFKKAKDINDSLPIKDKGNVEGSSLVSKKKSIGPNLSNCQRFPNRSFLCERSLESKGYGNVKTSHKCVHSFSELSDKSRRTKPELTTQLKSNDDNKVRSLNKSSLSLCNFTSLCNSCSMIKKNKSFGKKEQNFTYLKPKNYEKLSIIQTKFSTSRSNPKCISVDQKNLKNLDIGRFKHEEINHSDLSFKISAKSLVIGMHRKVNEEGIRYAQEQTPTTLTLNICDNKPVIKKPFLNPNHVTKTKFGEGEKQKNEEEQEENPTSKTSFLNLCASITSGFPTANARLKTGKYYNNPSCSSLIENSGAIACSGDEGGLQNISKISFALFDKVTSVPKSQESNCLRELFDNYNSNSTYSQADPNITSEKSDLPLNTSIEVTDIQDSKQQDVLNVSDAMGNPKTDPQLTSEVFGHQKIDSETQQYIKESDGPINDSNKVNLKESEVNKMAESREEFSHSESKEKDNNNIKGKNLETVEHSPASKLSTKKTKCVRLKEVTEFHKGTKKPSKAEASHMAHESCTTYDSDEHDTKRAKRRSRKRESLIFDSRDRMDLCRMCRKFCDFNSSPTPPSHGNDWCSRLKFYERHSNVGMNKKNFHDKPCPFGGSVPKQSAPPKPLKNIIRVKSKETQTFEDLQEIPNYQERLLSDDLKKEENFIRRDELVESIRKRGSAGGVKKSEELSIWQKFQKGGGLKCQIDTSQFVLKTSQTIRDNLPTKDFNKPHCQSASPFWLHSREHVQEIEPANPLTLQEQNSLDQKEELSKSIINDMNNPPNTVCLNTGEVHASNVDSSKSNRICLDIFCPILYN